MPVSQDESNRHLLNSLLTSEPSDYLPNGMPRMTANVPILDAREDALLIEVNGRRIWVEWERVTFYPLK